MLTKVCLVALVASASAFVPSQNARLTTKLNFEYGEYDEKLWDQVAKKDVYNKWDPSSPRSGKNFNPFETFKGNSPDASGVFPGENRYKDPTRGDASFAIMLAEKADAEERAANPKAGDAPGCAGCKCIQDMKESCANPSSLFFSILSTELIIPFVIYTKMTPVPRLLTFQVFE
ncbi:predicted protein [Thalassiosira pseudonana CCMP1335]|uniref:Uncharacterized protein n=1 Tax=Thalassiosira pseudonana TaxID=35128 RepID=B8C8S6_THAPS|nr:predicted protein [Thalassiosira pseudonana CCMP1335]EED90114.1 predicted protein [Thalassiosira pseudonana CCMP1335]